MKFQRILCLGVLLCSFTSAFAAICDVQNQPDERLALPHKTIETLEGTVMVAGTIATPEAVRTETAQLLRAPPAPDLEKQMREKTESLKGLLERFTNLRDYLFFGLTEKSFAFIMRDETPQNFMRYQQEAIELYNDDFTQGVRSGIDPNVREPLLLLYMGPLNLLRNRHPELFAGVTISVFDTSPVFEAAQKAPATPDTQAAAPTVSAARQRPNPDAIAAQFRRQFARNPKTLADFNYYVKNFKPSNYRGMSVAQIRTRAQRLVMGSAKPLIGKWVDAKMASLRAPAPETSAPAANANTQATDEVRRKEFDLGQALLNHKGTGIFLVEESAVDAVTTALVNACKRQP